MVKRRGNARLLYKFSPLSLMKEMNTKKVKSKKKTMEEDKYEKEEK